MLSDTDDDSEPYAGEYDEGETWLLVPSKMVGYAIGREGRNKNKIMEETDTHIKTRRVGDQTYFVIEGKLENRIMAKVKIKLLVKIGQMRNRGLSLTWFSFVDTNEGTFMLQPAPECSLKNGNYSKLILKSPLTEDNDEIGNFSLLFQELPGILQANEEKKRTNNVWCHFGNIYIKDCPDDDEYEYSLSEVESHIVPKRFFAPKVTKWGIKFCSGVNVEKIKQSILDQWLSSREQTCPTYFRYEITYLTPSCFELRLKIFIVVDEEKSNDSQTAYRSAKCPHEIHNVIKGSDSPPYFYICESTTKSAMMDIFEPCTQMDIRLITEANLISFSSKDIIYKEAMILYDYFKQHLKITKQGEILLPSENFPSDFDVHYSRTSKRSSYRVRSPDGQQFTARLSYEQHDDYFDRDFGNLDVHVVIDDCTSMTPKEIMDRVPQLLDCARSLAREIVPQLDQNIIPSEILSRGPKAQNAYETALKSGKVKNCLVPIVVVGQSRSGKTSLLRSLNGEKFNPSEDSTVGAKLQRSLSKVEGGHWEKNETEEHALYNQCAARATVEHLLKEPADLDDSDSAEDNDFYYNADNLAAEKDEEHGIRSLLDENDRLDINGSVTLQENVQQFQEDSKNAETDTAQGRKTVQEAVDNTLNVLDILKLPEEVATYTENILKNPNAAKQMENNLFLHTMDFAGQPVYSVTHPVFLPPKGIYLLVHSLENDLHAQAEPMVKYGAAERIIDDHCPMTNMDHLKFWLSLIAANSTLEGGSPVFAVSTHADKPFESDVTQTARKILDTLTRDDFAPGDHVVHGIYTVDNTVSGNGRPEDPAIERLKADMSRKARSLPQLNEDIPIRWLLFEKKLNQLVNEDQTRYISLKESETIAVKCGVDIKSDELSTLLDYLHDLKVIIYFPETNIIVIDTQWLLDMFAKVITVQPIEYHEGYKSEWRKLEQEGIVDVAFLKHLWCDLLDDHESVQSLLAIMEKFSLICEWKRVDGSKVFLVPAMLMNKSEEKANELVKRDDKVSPLVVRFGSSHLPFGLFPRVLVSMDEMCISKWPGCSPPHLSRNFARFYIVNDLFSLVFTSDVQTITIALVKEETPGDRDAFVVQLYCFLLNVLKRSLQKMIESFPWMKGLEFEFGIRCPICDGTAACAKHNKSYCSRDSCIHFVSEKELVKTPKPRCHMDPTNPLNVIPDSTFSQWFQITDNHSPDFKGVKKQLQTLSLSSNTVEDDLCKEITAAVNQYPRSISLDEATQKAKQLAIRLNLDKHCIEDPPKDITERCRKSCRQLITQGGEVCVQALRDELPSGMTGPLYVHHNALVKDMPFETKKHLSQALSAKEMEWKAFAKGKVDLSADEVDFLDKRKDNPVLDILNEKCRHWNMEHLYDSIVDSGAEAIADRYL